MSRSLFLLTEDPRSDSEIETSISIQLKAPQVSQLHKRKLFPSTNVRTKSVPDSSAKAPCV